MQQHWISRIGRATAICFGRPRPGKGTILCVMTALVGTRYTSFPTIETVAGRFGMQGLIGKSLAQIADMNTESRAQLGIAFARWQDKVVKKSIDKATSRPVCFNFARMPVRPPCSREDHRVATLGCQSAHNAKAGTFGAEQSMLCPASSLIWNSLFRPRASRTNPHRHCRRKER
jgi:hypothetical protein